MKEKWEAPRIAVETFASNEYVSSCLTVQLTCAIPGRSTSLVGDGTSAVSDSFGMSHGLCGNSSTSFVSDSTGNGYETIAGVVQRNRPISNVKFGDPNPRTYSADMPAPNQTVGATGTYFATWDSTDGAQHTGTYHHYGCAVVSDIDSQHPNRS